MSDSPRVAPAKPDEPSALPPGMRHRPSPLEIVAFVCQFFAFGSLALWGFAAWPFPWNLIAGIGAPVIAILVWALFVSPRAVLAVHPFIRGVVELLVYASATMAWWSLGFGWVGIGFGVIAVIVGVLTGRRRLA